MVAIYDYVNISLFSFFWCGTLLWAFVPSPKPLADSRQICPSPLWSAYFLFPNQKVQALYFAACWNILAALLCSSKSTSSPYTYLGVWNLGVYPMELVLEEPWLLSAVQISPNTTELTFTPELCVLRWFCFPLI